MTRNEKRRSLREIDKRLKQLSKALDILKRMQEAALLPKDKTYCEMRSYAIAKEASQLFLRRRSIVESTTSASRPSEQQVSTPVGR
jgi:transcription initiation factor TFIIIB Brf1 subunit/transcription initiation factor TFIIB